MSRSRKHIILLHPLFCSFPVGRSGLPPCVEAPQQHPPTPDGVYLIPHKTEGISLIGKKGGMYRRTPQGFIPDDFSHEQSLVIDSTKGLVILNSCSHGGVENIINEVHSTFPDKHIYALIGGFHLFTKPASVIRDIARAVDIMDIDLICTGHCTKERAYRILKKCRMIFDCKTVTRNCKNAFGTVFYRL